MRLLILLPFFLLLSSLHMDEVSSAKKSPKPPRKSKLKIKIKKKVKDCTQRTVKGDRVHVNYVGKLAGKNGAKFDSNPEGEPFAFTLGAKEVIAGWDRGLLNMCVGEKRKLVVPSRFAYGKRGMPPVIPPKATLVFNVELVRIGDMKNLNEANSKKAEL